MFVFFKSNAQISISGPTVICTGEIETYTLNNAKPGVTYTWSASTSQATINYQPNNQVTIQWNVSSEPSCHTLSVSGGGETANMGACVYDFPDPVISWDEEVGCQSYYAEGQYQSTYIEDDECINVCENSVVTYTVHGTLFNGEFNWSNFDWTVSGGVILKADGVPQPAGTTSITGGGCTSGTVTVIEVKWGNTGPGSISVTEKSFWTYYCENGQFPGHCLPKTKTLCVKVIESPEAFFTFDDLEKDELPVEECYTIWAGHTVNFKDFSTASDNSPIIAWEWDLGGDGTVPFSHLQNPSRTFDAPGDYHITLTVTNKCGCKSTLARDICVAESTGPTISCPSLECEGNSRTYSIDVGCGGFIWKVTGGTILNQQDYEVKVQWDNVGPDGFGYLSVDEDDCGPYPLPVKIKVPVVLKNGTIEGPATVCTNSSYIYELPAWPATNFKWELDNNTNGAWFGTYDENSHFVEVKTGATQGSFTLKCTYQNTLLSCAGADTITVDAKLQPEITTPERVCVNSACTCTVSNPPAGAGITTWSVVKPDGTIATQASASGSSSIVLSAAIFNMAGTYIIRASNPGNFCDPEQVTMKVVDPPAAPDYILGEDAVCLNYPYTYTTRVVENTIVTWAVTGGTISGSATGNSVTVTWTSPSNKSITATRAWEGLPLCSSAGFNKTIGHIVVSGAISGPASVCEDATDNYALSLQTGVEGETYFWYLTSGFGTVGSISSGQGTDACGVTWLHTGQNTTCTLYCDVVKCGVKTTLSYPIAINHNTQITSLDINPTDEICSGDLATFTAGVSGATASSFLWDFGDGYTITTATASTNHIFSNTTDQNMIFTVSVKAVSSCNGMVSDAFTANITVLPEPNASLSPADPITYCPPATFSENLYVSNTSSGTFSYQWMFDDDGPNPPRAITGATATTYTVTSNPPSTSPASTTCDGQYWCVVTNNQTGCTRETNFMIVSQDCGSAIPPGCTPQAPAGISNFNISLTDCATVQATCTTLGTPGGNILSYTWFIDANGVNYTSSGTETQNQSQEYTLEKPGIYKIQLFVEYVNSIPNDPPCTETKYGYIIVPMVADMKWGLACNATNDGYDLTLMDNTAVFPGNPVTDWEWRIDANPKSNSPTYSCPVNPGNHTIDLIVDNGTGFSCTASAQITVPELPVADYTVSTTYPGNPSSPYKSCEGREIVFTNTSTPMAGILKHVWDLKDGTSSHMVNPIKTYNISGQTNDYYPLLTVTDNYGCMASIQKQVTVYNNGFNYIPGSAYSPSSQDVCQGMAMQAISMNLTGSGTPPYTYQWYLGTDPLQGITGATLGGVPPGSGAYWVKVTDVNACYKEINPTPAMVSIQYPPTAIISGRQDVCHGDDIKLTALTGVDPSVAVDYMWTCSPAIGTFATKEVSFPSSSIQPGTYNFTLQVSYPGGGCSQTSQPFPVTVRELPPDPTINIDDVNCFNYEVYLSAHSSGTPPPSYNWSNGASGSSISVSKGGAYRVWATDQYGCRSHTDTEVPEAPDYYFWRFPTGCYSFCPEELPRWVDGPEFVQFEEWYWYKNGADLDPNGGGYDGHGTGVCHPLFLDDPGEATGAYSWKLRNELCEQETGLMNVEIRECCPAGISVEDFYCDDHFYYFTLSVDQGICDGASYNLYILDNAGLPAGVIRSLTPSTLNMGNTQVSGTFSLISPVTAITFKIEVMCGQETCLGFVIHEFEPCWGVKKGRSVITEKQAVQSRLLPKLDIMPNPASSQVDISYNLPGNDNMPVHNSAIMITDAMGRPVVNIPVKQAAGVYMLDVSRFAPGIYFVAINDNNLRLVTRQMVIQR